MARKLKYLNEEVLSAAKMALREMKRNSIAAKKLQAIVACSEERQGVVAKVFGVTQQTVCKWIRIFAQEGLRALEEKPKGHPPRKLNEAALQQVHDWLSEPDRHWTLQALVERIDECFGIRISVSAMWEAVHGLGFRLKVPRPRHARADAQKQQAFLKNLSHFHSATNVV